MKCSECFYWWADDDDGFCYCHADPNWEAPCERIDDYDDEEEG